MLHDVRGSTIADIRNQKRGAENYGNHIDSTDSGYSRKTLSKSDATKWFRSNKNDDNDNLYE